MTQRMRIAVLCGGQSIEHEISLLSARNIIAALDPKKYDVTLIVIDKKGAWHLDNSAQLLQAKEVNKLIEHGTSDNPLALIPGKNSALMSAHNGEALAKIDVVFPVLHGPLGEDGTAQGLLKLANIPFVGSDVLGSAVGMDKDVMKRLLREAGIPVAKFMVIHRRDISQLDFSIVTEKVGLPFFVKPANAGSSVGINKVRDLADFKKSIEIAFEYDNKILIEECVSGREIECAVLGNDSPIASIPGEIITQHDFYSYEAKYLDEHGARLEIPAKLSDDMVERVQELAIRSFQTLCCDGMARVDFFMTDKNELLVNELNTIPGFTNISMYPKMWEATGINYADLIERLIHLAIDKFQSQKRLKTEFSPHKL